MILFQIIELLVVVFIVYFALCFVVSIDPTIYEQTWAKIIMLIVKIIWVFLILYFGYFSFVDILRI